MRTVLVGLFGSARRSYFALGAAVTVVGAALVAPVAALATPTAGETFATEAAEKTTTEGTGVVKVFAIGIIGLIILITVVYFVFKLIRRVMK